MHGSVPHPPAVGQLVREEAARGTPFRFRVTTGSMAPLVLPGDELLIRAAPAESLRRGDLVLFDAGGRFVAHRLRGVQADGCLLTQGDRNLAADHPWPRSALIGVAVALVRGEQTLDLSAGPGRARAAWIGRLARLEQGTYGAARAVKRAVFGDRPLGMSVIVTRAVRGPFRALAQILANRRTV